MVAVASAKMTLQFPDLKKWLSPAVRSLPELVPAARDREKAVLVSGIPLPARQQLTGQCHQAA